VEAAPVDVKILICTTCSGHGTCDSSSVRSGDTTLMHNVLACNCSSGWSGSCHLVFKLCHIYIYVVSENICFKNVVHLLFR